MLYKDANKESEPRGPGFEFTPGWRSLPQTPNGIVEWWNNGTLGIEGGWRYDFMN